MAILLWLLKPLEIVLDVVLRIGRGVAIVAITVMVLAILLQVFFRYVLGNALPWPEELAIFLMLWMTAAIAPSAYRRGGFVALEIVSAALPKMAATVLSLVLLLISGVVLAFGVEMGWGEITSLAGKFKSASLYYPTSDGWEKMPNSWQIASFVTGLVLLFVVNIELILRALVTLFGGENQLRSALDAEMTAE
ncbi:TRAP transporter small permease [Marivita hallyeonensis]|uniref:TRAP transporter small permease protein n=1 Tax=Marivita hallyeonensis TaxID=996342 RepID=A0A1M5X736_9RHOB|nr:TRAP transporter small permease subunit [Marivita hallyeonensis]SHH95388.1 TRAP-type C4-dicarboxylate transport system, small permease component [Marivita hallyeonensis]